MTSELGETVVKPKAAMSLLRFLKLSTVGLTVCSTLVCSAFVGWLWIASRSLLADTTGGCFVIAALVSWCIALIGVLLSFVQVRRGVKCYWIAIASLLCLPVCAGAWTAGTTRLVYSLRPFYGNVQQTQSNIAQALEAYRVHHGAYPTSLFQLTTPVAFLTAIPWDPMSRYQPGSNPWRRPVFSPFDYYSDGSSFWILRSVGEDGDKDIDLPALGKKVSTTAVDQRGAILAQGIGREYCGAKKGGILNSGDVIKTGP